jgi:AcrR family transcriptional regulator
VGRPARLKAAAPAREQLRERLRALTRQSILQGAEAVLLRDGLDALTLDAIAAELGLTKQGLYYHYASKEALLAELALQEWTAAADAVQAATEAAADAGAALEALVRSYVGRYAGRLPMFRLATQGAQQSPLAARLGREQLQAIRPLNDRMYGPTEHKLREAQRAGQADPSLDPRRLAFVAHTSAMGLLTMQLMVSTIDDPLRHGEPALVDELCRALRAAVGGKAGGRAVRPQRASSSPRT